MTNPPDGLVTMAETNQAIKQLAPAVKIASFASYGVQTESKIVFYANLPGILFEASKRMLELLAGESPVNVIGIPFIRKDLSSGGIRK